MTKPILICGPCSIEEPGWFQSTADAIAQVVGWSGWCPWQWVLKGSYDKANRTTYNARRGPGLQRGLQALYEASERLVCPVTTDVHRLADLGHVQAYGIDVLQVPSLLSRQTDLIEACGSTGRVVSIKRGPGMSIPKFRCAAEKALQAGAAEVWLIERGQPSIRGDLEVGIKDLVDLRAETEQHERLKCILDCSHPGQNQSDVGTGGSWKYTQDLGRTALALGFDGVFVEAHPCPSEAFSDKATQTPLFALDRVLGGMLK